LGVLQYKSRVKYKIVVKDSAKVRAYLQSKIFFDYSF
jgi:hypothetical protein